MHLAARLLVVSLLLLSGVARANAPAVAWLEAESAADIERAFSKALAERKPVLLYWGAAWCPPCNQLKATLFNRRDFIERSKSFVAVHLDGDVPGAQQLGARFKVRGYPTLVLFSPDRTELTRLPGEVDAPQVLNVLQLGLAGGRPIEAVLADVPAGRALTSNEWRMLAYYSWDSAEARLAPAGRAELLASLAAACPLTEAQTRLWLKALAASDGATGVKADGRLRRRVLAVLADPAAARAQMDVLTSSAAEITRALDATGPREALLAGFERALVRLAADTSLSRADRLSALAARVELARIDVANGEPVALPGRLAGRVRTEAARLDREITDRYERQAVITAAAHVLQRAGLLSDSDALLSANLGRSHSPYYLMSQLAGNAKQRGDKAQALDWYARAYEASVGAATRLQWGASYVGALIDLAPDDAARIEHAADRLFAEAGAQSAAFHERGAASLQRAANKLRGWNRDGRHALALQRLQAQLDPACRKLDTADPQRGVCEGLLWDTAPRL